MAHKNKAWSGTLSAVKDGQMSLFKDKTKLKVAVLSLRGTKSVVADARTTQWTSYGLSILLDELNINVATCSPANMHEYDVVLYSVMSPTARTGLLRLSAPPLAACL